MTTELHTDPEHMTESQSRLSDAELQAAVEMYVETGGNKSEAARRLGLKRMTFCDRLVVAEKRLGIAIGKVADGRIEPIAHDKRALPEPGKVARYILTSVQNNTHLHPGWINIKAYSDWLDKLEGGTCEFIVGTYSYAIDAYGAKAVKRGSWKPDTKLWYAPEAEPYFKDERIELSDGLVWCGEMNILPTAANPLNGMETYNGRKSNIVPHAKIAMDSVASLADEGTKFNWTTGTITQRNYIQKRVGIMAEQSHAYGALLVEVDSIGNWWCRQLHLDGNGHLYDVGPAGGTPEGHVVYVADGQVGFRTGAVDSIVWGDIHASEMDPWVKECGWRSGGMLDVLMPKRQVQHDVFSMRSRGHHEIKDFHSTYKKMVAGIDSVEGEVQVTADFISYSYRPWCQTLIVPSNHDRHLDRWLNEADPRKDPGNAKYHMQLQSKLLDAFSRQDKTFSILEYALREKNIPSEVTFLLEDESYVICRDVDGGIEISLHGDRGPNGSRGSTRGLTKLGRGVIKGHDHTAAIRGGVYSVGACSLNFSYMHGPTGHSVSHCVVFGNGRRQIITMWEGKWRA
jgi:hypothetical protein